MFELDKKNYERLLDSILQIPFNMLMARSVLSGHVNGKVFVDSCESPQSFYVIHPYGMTYLCGRSDNEDFNAALFDYFKGLSYPREKDEWIQAFPRDWDPVLSPLIDEGIAIMNTRINFKFDKEAFYRNYNPINQLPYDIISTPVELLFEINGTVVPKDYWNTPEQFQRMAKAYTFFIDGKSASTAFSSARHGDKLEIGIETSPIHQGKGLGYLACAKLIEYCLDNHLEPVWSCRLENIYSVKLAKKLGFVEALRMPYYHIPKPSLSKTF